MIKITVGENDKDQRLDRFLRKYFNRAPLSLIYKMIRKDVKVNGRRSREDAFLAAGDEIAVYISDQEAAGLRHVVRQPRAKKQFTICYEDEDIIIVDKPFGLLTHGNAREHKNTLVNQVVDYLIEQGEYHPRQEQNFTPACVNRLDRNTTGLVIFGKTAEAVRTYNRLIADKEAVEKYYRTIVAGRIQSPTSLTGAMVKDQRTNTAVITEEEGAKTMESLVVPLDYKAGYTLTEVRLLTGRTHQIRIQLADMGHPIIGDPKYGDPRVNDRMRRRFSLNMQLLHCQRLVFQKGPIAGTTVTCDVPPGFRKIERALF